MPYIVDRPFSVSLGHVQGGPFTLEHDVPGSIWSFCWTEATDEELRERFSSQRAEFESLPEVSEEIDQYWSDSEAWEQSLDYYRLLFGGRIREAWEIDFESIDHDARAVVLYEHNLPRIHG